MRSHRNLWHNWSKLQRAVPVFTSSVAFIAIVASTLGFISLTISEQIILAILGLLAIDTLIERKQVLENIQNDLSALSKEAESRPFIIRQSELLQKQPLAVSLEETNELFISGGSLIGIFSRQRRFIRQWLNLTKDVKLLVILENPEAALHGTTPVWSSDIDKTRKMYAQDIRDALKIIAALQNEFPEKIEVRLTNQVPSLTVMIFDRSKATVSLNLYVGEAEIRPVFELSKVRHPKWFSLFKERYYDQLWNESSVWKANMMDDGTDAE